MNQPLHKLGPGAVSVTGFYRTLLRTQASGLTGHIGEVFPDLSKDSAWLGGHGESWERGPYYLDGLVPLAFLLHDEHLIDEANLWIGAILKSQRMDGFFGPTSNEDWWPRFVVTKVFTTYYRLTGDSRILPFLTAFFDYVIAHIEAKPLYFWAYARGLECSEALELVYESTKNEKYKALGKTLIRQSIDWDSYFSDFPYHKTTTHYLSRTLFHALRPLFANQAKKEQEHPETVRPKTIEEIATFNQSNFVQHYLKTHGVNIAMALKYPLYRQYFENHEPDANPVWEGLEQLLKYHGNALDLFSSDEHLNGPKPTQGVELCVVVEAMYSMEEILRLTGDPKAADYLEYYAYNALLATLTSDMCAHQYVQQVNQKRASVSHHHFYDAGKDATTFGVAPFFGCCAANMHQGFPKFVENAVYTKEDALYIYLYIPGHYDVAFADGHIIFDVETKYPFDDSVKITVVEVSTKAPKNLFVRIPYAEPAEIIGGAATRKINQVPLEDLGMLRTGLSFTLRFFPEIKTIHDAAKTFSLRRGSILFAYKIPAREIPLRGQAPFHDRAFVPLKQFTTPHPEITMAYRHPETAHCSATLLNRHLEGDDIHHYLFEIACREAVKEKLLYKNELVPAVEKKFVLVPYGLTRLRIAQFK